MTDEKIKIDKYELNSSLGKPFEFSGVHARRNLAGIEVVVIARYEDEIQLIEELIKKKTIMVYDPFVKRDYEAIFGKRTSSHQEGRPEKRFHFEIKELDLAQQFKHLEIEGHRFHVLRNAEKLLDEEIGIHVLLRLSPDEFLLLRNLLESEQVEIQRIEIDENPIVRRFGGAQYWSLHREESQTFYKHIVRFFPVDLAKSNLNIASRHEQNAHASMILSLSARFEALVNILAEQDQISQNNKTSLLDEKWQELVDAERRIKLISSLDAINDAESELL